MTTVKVVDLNEAGKELPALEPIEEAPEEAPEEVINEVVAETTHGSLNSNTVGVETNTNEETKEEVKEEMKEEVKAKPKPKPKPKASDIVPCPDCNKNMTYKNLRYSHKCSPEPPPVKKQAKPKAKQQPKPKPPPEVYYSDSEEEEQTTHKPLSKPVRNQILKAQYINPQTALAQHYQLLQQQFIKQKQEKMNSLCQNMFSSKTKKR